MFGCRVVVTCVLLRFDYGCLFVAWVALRATTIGLLFGWLLLVVCCGFSVCICVVDVCRFVLMAVVVVSCFHWFGWCLVLIGKLVHLCGFARVGVVGFWWF